MTNKVAITLFRWAGSWGPFKVKIPCGECALTLDIIQDVLKNELNGIEIELDIRDWLTEWWKPLIRGGWHAPIVMVNGKVISQGAALNRGVLTQSVIENYSATAVLEGSHIFGKDSCPHCTRAKGYLDEAGVDYSFHDVIRSERALYEMLGRVKPIVGPTTPITVPQIWIDGKYIGGADQLGNILHKLVEPNYDRGHCSISPKR